MTLIVENVNDDLAKAIKSIAKIANAKVKTQKPKTKGGALREALKEVEFMKANPHLYKSYTDMDSLAKALRDEI